MKKILTIFILLSIPSILFAVDELYLTGKILSYEPDTGKIKIDVISSSCKGVREFITEKGLSKDLLINKTVDFGIDSDHCEKFKTYRIKTPLLK